MAGTSTAETITAGAREAQSTLVNASTDAANQVKSLAADVERSLSAVGTSTAEAITAGAREAQSTLVTASMDATNQVRSLAADVERSLSIAGTSTAEAVTAGAREAQTTLINASTDAASQVKSLAADIQRSLSMAGTSTAETLTMAGASTAEALTSGARDAQNMLVNASADATSQVRSLAADIQRSLSMAGASTSEALTSGAREAQNTLVAASVGCRQPRQVARDRCGTHLDGGRRRHRRLDPRQRARGAKLADGDFRRCSQPDQGDRCTDIERSLSAVTANTTDNIQTSALNAQSALVAASNEVSSKVKSTSAEVERTVLAASGSFGSTMTGKTDEIVTYVQQQTDRLSQMIDGKRGTLVEAIGSKTSQLTVDIDRVTSDALKSIETRGQAFSQTMMTHGSDVARTITSAGELATGAVAKSLKELEQSSRAAIDQSRQVSIAAVTEMQETSKILRTDTVALFERLREGNILLQEVLTGAHDNLNSLERALVTRVADFVSAMNDVTSRNGVATQTLEDQLSVFNAKTSKALEDLGSLSSQFEHHGQALVEAAAVVEQSNRSTTASVSERKSALESLVTTIDLRTADLDQRLSRFTSLLDESLAAAEERARDIARVVAETAGAGSAAISHQFEAVRAAAEEERRLTADTMAELYQQGTQEADAMFKQSAEKFANMVASMKQMASEMHNELDATRNELRRGVLEMPQEAAESTAQMRKVIVDQIEALAELNRIVAHHGRGLDVVSAGRASVQREEEPMLVAAGGQSRSAPRMGGSAASTLPPPDLGGPAPRRTEAPPVSPASSDQGRDGWLSDLLNRTDAAGPAQAPRRPRAAPGGSERQSAGVAVARHRPPDGSQPRRRDVGSLSARREQGVHKTALHAGRPEGLRRGRPQIPRRPRLQADGGPLHHRVRAAARRGRPRRARPGDAAQPPHLGNRAGLHPARACGGTAGVSCD